MCSEWCRPGGARCGPPKRTKCPGHSMAERLIRSAKRVAGQRLVPHCEPGMKPITLASGATPCRAKYRARIVTFGCRDMEFGEIEGRCGKGQKPSRAASFFRLHARQSAVAPWSYRPSALLAAQNQRADECDCSVTARQSARSGVAIAPRHNAGRVRSVPCPGSRAGRFAGHVCHRSERYRRRAVHAAMGHGLAWLTLPHAPVESADRGLHQGQVSTTSPRKAVWTIKIRTEMMLHLIDISQ